MCAFQGCLQGEVPLYFNFINHLWLFVFESVTCYPHPSCTPPYGSNYLRSVVFMDEAGLPEESHESLKVRHLHEYAWQRQRKIHCKIYALAVMVDTHNCINELQSAFFANMIYEGRQ